MSTTKTQKREHSVILGELCLSRDLCILLRFYIFLHKWENGIDLVTSTYVSLQWIFNETQQWLQKPLKQLRNWGTASKCLPVSTTISGFINALWKNNMKQAFFAFWEQPYTNKGNFLGWEICLSIYLRG